MSPGPLRGRHALVTGATRGIGRACATALAEMGASVVVVARTPGDVAATVDELAGAGHSGCAADVTTDAGTAAMVDHLAGSGAPHIVVANARGPFRWARFGRTDPGALATAVAENLGWIEAVAPGAFEAQRAAGFGRWIAVSSLTAHLGGPGQSAYVAVKAALEGLMRTIAVEQGEFGVTANSVVAGFIDTPTTQANYDAESYGRLSVMNVVGRAGTADEVAHVVASLAHPLAAYVTGVSVPVCGGTDLGWALAPRRDRADKETHSAAAESRP